MQASGAEDDVGLIKGKNGYVVAPGDENAIAFGRTPTQASRAVGHAHVGVALCAMLVLSRPHTHRPSPCFHSEH